jgi:hypothetical protein
MNTRLGCQGEGIRVGAGSGPAKLRALDTADAPRLAFLITDHRPNMRDEVLL